MIAEAFWGSGSNGWAVGTVSWQVWRLGTCAGSTPSLTSSTRLSPSLWEKNLALHLSSSLLFPLSFPSYDLLSCPCGPEPSKGSQGSWDDVEVGLQCPPDELRWTLSLLAISVFWTYFIKYMCQNVIEGVKWDLLCKRLSQKKYSINVGYSCYHYDNYYGERRVRV